MKSRQPISARFVSCMFKGAAVMSASSGVFQAGGGGTTRLLRLSDFRVPIELHVCARPILASYGR